MTDNKNSPAFPVIIDGRVMTIDDKDQQWLAQCNPMIGLSKREYFAGLALQGLLANSTINQGYSSCLDWARSAVEFADALINELSKTQP